MRWVPAASSRQEASVAPVGPQRVLPSGRTTSNRSVAAPGGLDHAHLVALADCSAGARKAVDLGVLGDRPGLAGRVKGDRRAGRGVVEALDRGHERAVAGAVGVDAQRVGPGRGQLTRQLVGEGRPADDAGPEADRGQRVDGASGRDHPDPDHIPVVAGERQVANLHAACDRAVDALAVGDVAVAADGGGGLGMAQRPRRRGDQQSPQHQSPPSPGHRATDAPVAMSNGADTSRKRGRTGG